MAGLRGAFGRRRRQALTLAREALELRALPPRVAGFYVRAWLTALRAGDRFTLDSATRPSDVSRLLALARGHATTAELGTGTAWTTIALALADADRRVVSYDPEERVQRERYLRLIPAHARARIELLTGAAEDVQPAPESVGFLFIDCSHDRETTAAAFKAWRPAMAPEGVVVFHDYDHPRYPGVREAVEQLGLRGTSSDGVFIWRVPSA
jgi:SAM-dependent methyltransferase